MQYDGIIDSKIKAEAKKVLEMENAGKATREACIKAVDMIQAALAKKREPFYEQVDNIALKCKNSNNQLILCSAQKELDEISITFDIEAEKLIYALWKKYSDNKRF